MSLKSSTTTGLPLAETTAMAYMRSRRRPVILVETFRPQVESDDLRDVVVAEIVHSKTCGTSLRTGRRDEF